MQKGEIHEKAGKSPTIEKENEKESEKENEASTV